MSLTVKWRGKPVFIRNRTDQGDRGGEGRSGLAVCPIQYARNANLAADAPATDANRAADGREAWLIQIGICTHLGCVPLGQQGAYGGWFCPCHGSVNTTRPAASGRARRRRTCISRSIRSCPTRSSGSAERGGA